ncbi:MAG TPA: hypothetical protein VLT79_11235 [Gemmatimonadales bacterium]|nr:hypothetical protein [Gemmatimonadales bacterium]
MTVRSGLTLLCSLVVLGCGGGTRQVRVDVPPVLNLKPYGRVGLARFTVEKAKGQLDEIATERFSEAVLSAQPGVEVLELGAADSIRKRVGEPTQGAGTAQAIGTSRGIPAVFVGHMKVSNVTPSGGLHGLSLPHLEATVSVELTVALLSTESGGTLWRSSGTMTEKVGGLALVDGEPYFSAKDPNKAYVNMVDNLVDYVTRDLRSTWTWQTVSSR